MRHTLVPLLGLGILSAPLMAETTRLPNIVVLGEHEPNEAAVELADFPGVPVDGGAILRQANGVDAGRMGGHGLEPVIRGQSQDRVNVLLDGAYLFGGCPNRMDPPTTYANTSLYDRVRVIKGVQTLLWGGGGSGGTVLFERDTRVPEKGWGLDYQLGTGNNGLRHDASVDGVLGSERGWLRLFAGDAEAGDYEDGNGNPVRSAWKDRKAAVSTGFALGARTRVELGVDHDRTRDVLYAGAGMDSPEADATTARIRVDHEFAGEHLEAVRFQFSRATVDHLMDNYSLRPNTGMWARAPSTSDTDSGRLLFDLNLGEWALTAGLDLLDNRRDAARYTGPAGSDPTTLNSLIWPDVRIARYGLVVEGERPLGTGLLRAGLRYDRVEYEARKATQDPPGMARSPDALYSAYYGTTAGSGGRENNWGGLLRYEHRLGPGTTLFAGISRSLRTADATERYMASNGMTPMMRWVGNPDLRPEAHHQIDTGLTLRRQAWRASAVAWYDQVRDYILRDRAHGQDGILLADGATIYRNVDARLYGLELEASRRLRDGLVLAGDLAWVRATNTSDDRPIAQTPPLQGSLRLERRDADWRYGGRVRWAARQDRVEDDWTTDSGLDAGPTPGWAVLDLYASLRLDRRLDIAAGVDNVFDKAYANHLNRSNLDPFNPLPVRVNEPGMTAWLKLSGRF